jgi:hypothetical protein
MAKNAAIEDTRTRIIVNTRETAGIITARVRGAVVVV